MGGFDTICRMFGFLLQSSLSCVCFFLESKWKLSKMYTVTISLNGRVDHVPWRVVKHTYQYRSFFKVKRIEVSNWLWTILIVHCLSGIAVSCFHFDIFGWSFSNRRPTTSPTKRNCSEIGSSLRWSSRTNPDFIDRRFQKDSRFVKSSKFIINPATSQPRTFQQTCSTSSGNLAINIRLLYFLFVVGLKVALAQGCCWHLALIDTSRRYSCHLSL